MSLKPGDVFEYDNHYGVVIEITSYFKISWLFAHPNFNFRSSHPDADWYVPDEFVGRFRKVTTAEGIPA